MTTDELVEGLVHAVLPSTLKAARSEDPLKMMIHLWLWVKERQERGETIPADVGVLLSLCELRYVTQASLCLNKPLIEVILCAMEGDINSLCDLLRWYKEYLGVSWVQDRLAQAGQHEDMTVLKKVGKAIAASTLLKNTKEMRAKAYIGVHLAEIQNWDKTDESMACLLGCDVETIRRARAFWRISRKGGRKGSPYSKIKAEVRRLAKEGKSYKEIGRSTGLSPKSIRKMLSSEENA